MSKCHKTKRFAKYTKTFIKTIIKTKLKQKVREFATFLTGVIWSHFDRFMSTNSYQSRLVWFYHQMTVLTIKSCLLFQYCRYLSDTHANKATCFYHCCCCCCMQRKLVAYLMLSQIFIFSSKSSSSLISCIAGTTHFPHGLFPWVVFFFSLICSGPSSLLLLPQ